MPKLGSLVVPSAQMPVKGEGTAYWYDMLGRMHHSDEYDNSYITAPAAMGLYLLVLQDKDTRTIHQVMVR